MVIVVLLVLHGTAPRPGATRFPRLLERGHDLAGQDRETPLHTLGRDEPAGVELGDDAGEAQLLAESREAVDQAGGAAERDALGQDLLVRQSGEPFDASLQALGGTGTRASHGGLL